MTIEDLIISLSGILSNDEVKQWDHEFIIDLASKIEENNDFALTSKQAETAIRVLKRNSEHFRSDYAYESLLKNPTYRNEIRKTVLIKNEVRACGVTSLAFRFKYNESLIKKFKLLMSKSNSVTYNKTYKIWTVSVNASNAKEISDIIGEYAFDFDDDVLLVLARGLETRNPVFSIVDGELLVEHENTIAAIVAARNI